jgi:hypothetical protein
LKKFISAGLKEEIHTNIATEIDKEIMPKICLLLRLSVPSKLETFSEKKMKSQSE